MENINIIKRLERSCFISFGSAVLLFVLLLDLVISSFLFHVLLCRYSYCCYI